jgi:hypothetical protein
MPESAPAGDPSCQHRTIVPNFEMARVTEGGLEVPLDCEDCHSPAVLVRTYTVEEQRQLSIDDRNDWYRDEYAHLDTLVPDDEANDPAALLERAGATIMQAAGATAGIVFRAGELLGPRGLPTAHVVKDTREELLELIALLEDAETILKHVEPLLRHGTTTTQEATDDD